jgi:hypothetical protein
VLIGRDHSGKPDLRVLRRLPDVVDLRAPDIGGEESFQQVVTVEFFCLRVDLLPDLVALVEEGLQIVVDRQLRRLQRLIKIL